MLALRDRFAPMNSFHSAVSLSTLACCVALSAGASPASSQPALTPLNAAQSTLVTAAPAAAISAAEYERLAAEVETNLQRHVLAMWFPRAIDRERGGFHQVFSDAWARRDDNMRSVVYQSRLTWLSAQAALRFPQEKEKYAAWSRHGLDYLAKVLWDAKQGGFFWAVDENGKPTTERGSEKHVYGIAFGIYAAAANYRATRDPRALDLARRAYNWLDWRAHDAKNGGYYEALARSGRVMHESLDPATRKTDAIGTRYGYKSMNSHIHILEALTALYEVWPNPKLQVRLREVFRIVRDTIVVEKAGAMNLYFTPDWRAIPDHDSFGHDVETAYLLVEAAAALKMPKDARTWKVARNLVDHALEWGWDEKNGGFYDAGATFGKVSNTDKIWWVQAEGLNALLLMHEQFRAQTPRYWEAFNRQWQFIEKHQVDARHDGWYSVVSQDGQPTPGRTKSDSWTEGYHQGRALLNVSASLRHLAGKPVSGHKVATQPGAATK
ncbi:MAG: cellobiose epimerase [Abditibacteriota bacterium]|nr:cellobiose epimerase [Abditibacteriota bacterium]